MYEARKGKFIEIRIIGADYTPEELRIVEDALRCARLAAAQERVPFKLATTLLSAVVYIRRSHEDTEPEIRRSHT